MLPLAHTYISTKVTNKKNNILIFGSVLPDIATTSRGNLGRKEIHDSPMEIYEYIKSKYPNLIDLGLGVMLHSGINNGADYYTDDYKIGFAYTNGKNINEDVAKMLNIEPNDKTLVLSHNFIEGAIDILLAKKIPQLVEDYKQAMEQVTIGEVSEMLSSYLNSNKTVITSEIDNLKQFLNYTHLTSIDGIVDGMAGPLIKIRLKQDFDRDMAIKIMRNSVELIKDTYEDFLNDTVEKMKITFKEYI